MASSLRKKRVSIISLSERMKIPANRPKGIVSESSDLLINTQIISKQFLRSGEKAQVRELIYLKRICDKKTRN